MHCEKMFAFYNIKDMEDRMAGASGQEANRLKQSAIHISKESGVMCAFTAMYTVLEGVEMHLQPLNQDGLGAPMQPFTQAQCRGQERYNSLAPGFCCDTSASFALNRGESIGGRVDCRWSPSAMDDFESAESRPWTIIAAIIAVLIIILSLALGIGLRSSESNPKINS
jgi:hypothetical protein